MKTFPSSQIPLIERDPSQLIYFAHIYMAGETLYFSDRNFKFNGHTYEAYLLDIPQMAHSIERFGGYLNVQAPLTYKNDRFRSYDKLIDYFIVNPLESREMDLYLLYLDNGEIPETDVSTKLHRLVFGEWSLIDEEKLQVEMFSIIHSMENKKIFSEINKSLYPAADPKAIGEYENIIYGSVKNVPCPFVITGAVSSLYADLSATATEVFLTDVDYPIPFPYPAGVIQIGGEKMGYTGIDQANKKLTGVTRGAYSTLAIEHQEGEAVWLILSSYSALMAGIKLKSFSNAYINGQRINPSDYTTNLDWYGKSLISFTRKPLNRHAHGQKSVYEMRPIYGSHQDIEGTIYWQGVDTAMYDQDTGTWQRFAYLGTIPEAKTGDFILNFPGYYGDVPDAVYVVIVLKSGFTGLYGEYCWLAGPEFIDIGIVEPQGTVRLKLSGVTVPTEIRIRGHTDAVPSGGWCEFDVAEAWLEIERWAVNPGGSPDEVLAPLTTIDGEGIQDDVLGTYTGVANALIENPSDVIRHFITAILGRSMSEISDSFATTRYIFGLMGFKFSLLINRIGSTPPKIIKKLAFLCRSEIREDGGKFEMRFLGDYYGADQLPTNGWGLSTSSADGSHPGAHSVDDDLATFWKAANTTYPQWIKEDFVSGVGASKTIRVLSILPFFENGHSVVKGFTLSGSNNDVDYTDIYTGEHTDTVDMEIFKFANTIAYRYYKLSINSKWDSAAATVAIYEWELREWVDYTPVSVVTIDKTIYVGVPQFKMTPSMEKRDLIRAKYDLDWSGRNSGTSKYGNYQNQVESGTGEKTEDIELMGIREKVFAQDTIDYYRGQKENIVPIVNLECNPLIRKLERGDHFTLNDCPVSSWEGALWRVLDFQESPDQQRFRIEAIKYVSS